MLKIIVITRLRVLLHDKSLLINPHNILCLLVFVLKKIFFAVSKFTEMFLIFILMNISFHLFYLFYLWAININKIQIWKKKNPETIVLQSIHYAFIARHQNSFLILCQERSPDVDPLIEFFSYIWWLFGYKS